MLDLSEDVRKFVSTRKKQVVEPDSTCLSIVTQKQLEVVSLLFDVSYDSRFSFQDRRFRVLFFLSHNHESLKEYLKRRVFYAGGGSFLPYICVDEAHLPDGLVLTPNGELAIFCDASKQHVIYSGVEKILERDALLEKQEYEYAGTIIFKSHVTAPVILACLKDFEAFGPASDEQNIVVQSRDAVCILQWWYHFYTPSFMDKARDCTLRVFSSTEGAFAMVRELFDPKDLVCAVSSTDSA